MNATREEALFALALTKPTAERAAWLDRECGDDKTLRQRLEALLAAHEQSEGVLGETVPEEKRTLEIDLSEEPGDETIGATIGHYKVLQSIGEGGCGAVYMAEQTEPLRRRVALKVIKLGMDTKAVIARFEAERQALALMDHPNIARVLDAGSTDSGRPYFVMELVRGIKITDYCDQNKLDTKQRLELFIQVCQAIQHAHQKGIIHRDIKPSNILVTLHDGIPVPKVIDFGIAKATTDQRLTDKTLFTAYEQFIGTPAYMSPEQAEMSGLDIDTRTDIYSLGVLLYELLTGRTPFDGRELMSLGIDAMRKTIREKEPVRPSTKLHTLQGEDITTTAQSHGADLPKLVHLLRGDLDWIAMKCLEKDRTRRYDTANGLAMDIQRHLNNEPVVARPPSKLYEFQKTVRRHKVGFAATAAVMIALAAGIAVATWQAVLATHAKEEAIVAQESEMEQRQKAVDNEKIALAAQEEAEKAELKARQRAYASDMNVAKLALDGNNLGRAIGLLNRQRPKPGERDLRGWEWRYLWKQTRSDAEMTLCHKNSEICTLTASSDGRLLAAADYHHGRLSLWDLQTRQEIEEIVVGENLFSVQAAFAPAGSLLAYTDASNLASGDARYTLHLWNVITKKVELEVALEELCLGLAFAPDGRTLVISTKNHITLWSVPEGRKLASYPCPQNNLVATTAFAVTPDSKLAAYGLPLKQVRVLDLQAGKELWSAQVSMQFITALAFSPDGKTLASAAGFGEKTIRLWDVATGQEIRPALEGHDSFVSSIVFLPDGKRLASGSGDQTIRIWDVTTRECLDVLRGHTLEVYRLALLPNSNLLASGSKDGEVCLWDTSVTHPRQLRHTIADNVTEFCFTADSQSVRTVDRQGNVMEWTGEGFNQKSQLLKISPLIQDWSSCFSSDGRLLAAATETGFIETWDLQSRNSKYQLKDTPGSEPLHFLGDGNRLLIWSGTEHSLEEWDLVTKRKLHAWTQPIDHLWEHPTAISPDERQFIAVGFGGDTVCGSLEDGSQRNLDLNHLETMGLTYSPDGKHLVLGSTLGFARVFDTDTWSERAKLQGFLVAVEGVAFSPGGRRLATGSDDTQALRLWDTESWQDVLTLEGGSDSSSIQIFYSPDGKRIGAMGQTGTLLIWSAPSWEEIENAEIGDNKFNNP